MRRPAAFLAVAAAGAAVFAAAAWDVHAGGWASRSLDPAVNGFVLRAEAGGFPCGDVGALLSLAGAGPVVVPLVILAAAALAWWRRWAMAASALAVPWLGGQLVDALKEAFRRGFPPGDVGFSTGYGAAAAEVRNPEPFAGSAYAFPSGHTMGAVLSVGLAALLVLEAWMARRGFGAGKAWRWRRRALAACASVAALAGVGRVLLTVHWATDVIASWGLGVALAAGALWATGWGGPSPLGPAPGGRPMRILGFTGMPGSGKSEAMEVAKARGIPVVRMGDLIWEEVERRGLPRDAKHVGEVAHAMRESQGPDVWSRRTVERVRTVGAGKPLVIIDGVRSNHEVETFRRELGGDFVLVAIHTDRHHRFERMLRRGRVDDPKEEAVLEARDTREIGWGMAQAIALADEMVVNDGSLEQFKAKVAALLDRLSR